MNFLSVENVTQLHAQLLARYGGATGIRDQGLLASAVARAEQRAFYDPLADVPTLAAALSWGLMRNHAFIDGNKRVAMAALTVFMNSNGCRLEASESALIDIALRAAAGEIDEEGWTTWVRSASRRR